MVDHNYESHPDMETKQSLDFRQQPILQNAPP